MGFIDKEPAVRVSNQLFAVNGHAPTRNEEGAAGAGQYGNVYCFLKNSMVAVSMIDAGSVVRLLRVTSYCLGDERPLG
jgi:hypothetical protein